MSDHLNVLIVDDDVEVSRILQEILQEGGYETTTAGNGWEGMEKLKGGRFDVIISDIRMPKMDGMEFLRRVKEHDPALPVVMLTGYPELEVAIRAMKGGAADFISKPFTPDQVRQSLEELLKNKRLIEADPQLLKKMDSINVMEGSDQKLSQKARDLARFKSLNETIDFVEDQDVLFHRLVELAPKVAEAGKAVVLLLDRDTRQLMPKAAEGLFLNKFMDFGISLESSLIGKSILKGKPFLVQGMEKDPFIDFLLNGQGMVNSSWLCVPFMIREEVIGALAVTEKLEGGDFSQEDMLLLVALVSKAALVLENMALYESIYRNLVDTLKAMVNTLEAKDYYTRQHSQRVTQWAVEIAQKMGRTSQEIETLRFAGFLHDIGKIGVQDSILNKPGGLSPEEFSAIRAHPLIGERIVEPLGLLPLEREIIRHHHERWDGQGYPDGLLRENIPLLARVLAVADSFDAMTSDRPYRRAKSYEESLQELERFSGSQFDKDVVCAFKEVLRVKAKQWRED